MYHLTATYETAIERYLFTFNRAWRKEDHNDKSCVKSRTFYLTCVINRP